METIKRSGKTPMELARSCTRSLKLIVIVLAVNALIACSSGDDKPTSNLPDEPPQPPEPVMVSGKVQKGEFTSLQVDVYPISDSGQVGTPFAAQTTGSEYSFESQPGQVLNVKAYGTFVDEVSGAERSIGPEQALQSVFAAGTDVQNVNILTTLSTQLWQADRADGDGADDGESTLATYQAKQSQIAQTLGFEAQQNFAALDISNIESLDDPSFKLLTLAGGLLQQDPEGTSLPLGLTATFDAIQADLPLNIALDVFNGIDVGAVYTEIQQSGFIANLPELDIGEGSIFVCEPVCGIVQVLGNSVNISARVIYEGQGRTGVRLTRTGADVSQLTLNVSVTDQSAQVNNDYAVAANTVTFPVGAQTTFFFIDPVIDQESEGNEQFAVNLSLPDNADYTLIRSSVTITVKDGLPASARLPEALALRTSGCFVAVGLPSELIQNLGTLVCANDVQSGIAFDTNNLSETAVQFLSSVEADCSNGQCANSTYWPFSVMLEVLDTSADAVISSAQVGTVLYNTAQHIANGANPANVPTQARLANVSARQISSLLSTAIANGYALQLRLVSPESTLANVVSDTIQLPLLAPSSTITFGDSHFDLLAGAVLSAGSGCPNEHDILVNGTFVQPLVLNGVQTQAEYSGEVCASFVPTEAGATGEAGSWVVSQSNIDITDQELMLPSNAFYFFEVSATGQQTQRTVDALGVARLGALPITEDVTLNSVIGSDELPFAFNVVGGRLTENGIVVNYDRTVLLEQPMFDASDPRAQTSTSNTNLYANISAGEFILGSFGISGTVNVLAGSTQTSWPKGTLAWQAFSLEIFNGQIEDHSVAVSFSMSQTTDCSQARCSQGNKQEHAVSGILNIDAQGSGIANAQYASNSRLSWGALDNGNLSENAWELVGALTQNAPATLVIPGFIQRYLPGTAENAADGLVAHRRSSTFIHSTFGPSSDEFTLGNFFAAGINVGPEIYVNGSGQPEVANGNSLANLSFSLARPNNTTQSVSTHVATKFVIQNAGITGVSNADPTTMPTQFNASGFDINLERFALRTQQNTNDSYNWIDGSLRLEGDAKIGMAFNNLALACDGSLGDAQMLSQACGEQCRLDSWRADIDIFNFTFATPNGAPLACSSESANLSLEHDIAFKALDKNIAMRTFWNAQGELQSSVSNSQSQYRFDSRSNKDGFPTIVESLALNAPLDLTEPENVRYGTLSMKANIGLPFWLPLAADIRLANTTSFGTSVAEPSVVLPKASFDTASFQAIENALNLDLQAQILTNEQFDFNARYEWGNTGFGFQLPVYYDLALSADEVGFLGRKKEIDLFVLDAGAGIDFIQPDRTKLSFGASADFAALKEVRFQIDLTDTAGLAKIDELLVKAKIIQEPIITPTFENISNAVSFVNDIAGRGLDPLMEKLLLEAVTNVGQAAIPAMPNRKDPFETLADGMAELKNLPNQLIAQSDQIVFDPINQLLDQQELAIRSELLSLVVQIESLSPSDSLTPALIAEIDRASEVITQAETTINSVFEPVDALVSQMSAQVQQIEDSVEDAQAARNEIEAVFNEVTAVVAAQCAVDGSIIGSESAGYLQAAFTQLNDIKGLVQLLSSSEALATLADLVVEDPQVKESINTTQDTLREGAELLLSKITEAEIAVRDRLCQSDITSLLAQVDQLLLQVDSNIAQMQQVIMRIDNDLIVVKVAVNNAKAKITGPLGDIKSILDDIERYAIEELDAANGETLIFAINAQLNDLDTLGVNVLVSRSPTETDIFDVAFDEVRDILNLRRRDLIEALNTQTDGLFPYGDMSADQLRRQLVSLVMASEPVSALRQELNTNVLEIIRQANSQVLVITDQANAIVQEALAKVESEANKVLEEATAPIRDIPLDSGKLDGFAVIAGNELERAHIGAQWTMSSSDESEPGNTFGAALDAVSWAANGKAEGCAAPGAESNLDITISAMGIPAKIGESEITIKKVYLGFTLGSSTDGFAFKPIGVNGGISTTGEIGFTEFIIYDPAFAAGIGLQEVYLGASAGAVFSAIQAEVAFLVGKTCNKDVLGELDPKFAQYITIPGPSFTGAYVRGAASVPVYSNGCPLTIGVAADMGAWILKGPPLTLGGLVGGGAYGKVGCVGALRGQIRALGQVNTDGDITFIGEGFGVAGLGLCEPAGWTTVERSRQDGFCGTADAIFTAGYQDGWSVFNLSVSAIH